ncbi:transposable element Tcb1 transposase [Trichonephila clavipes]|nr:transposable element Tcb1 transposase [Trichonephila clavipes]
MKERCWRQNGMKLSLLTNYASVCNTTMVGFESGDTVERGCRGGAGPPHWSCTGYYGMGRYWISLAHSSSTHCRYFKQPALHLRGIGASCPSLPSGYYFNRIMRNHTWHALSKCSSSITRLNYFPGRLARSPDFSPIENMWSMVAQRLTQITPPAATPDQLWQRVEAAWFVVPQEHIQSLFESMPRRVAAVISNNGGYSGY